MREKLMKLGRPFVVDAGAAASARRDVVDRPPVGAHVLGVQRRGAGAVAPDRLDRPELGVRHLRGLGHIGHGKESKGT